MSSAESRYTSAATGPSSSPRSVVSIQSRVARIRPRTIRSSSRYGSRSLPARARSSGVAASSESSSRRASISSRYRSAAAHRDSQHARRVTCGVTCGLPSRSPPIHEPKRIGAASTGSPRPVLTRRARSIVRAKTRHRVPQALLEHDEAAAHLVDRRRDAARVPRSSPRRFRFHGEERRPARRARRSSGPGRSRVGQRTRNAIVLLHDPAARHFGRDAPSGPARSAARTPPRAADPERYLPRADARSCPRTSLAAAVPSGSR